MLQVKAELIILHLCVGGRGGRCWDLRWRGHPHTQYLHPQGCPGRQLWEKDWGTKQKLFDVTWTDVTSILCSLLGWCQSHTCTHQVPLVIYLEFLHVNPVAWAIVEGFIIVHTPTCYILFKCVLLLVQKWPNGNFLLFVYCLSSLFQKRTVKKNQEAKPKPKKDSDVVRERIIRRAALEFQDGMYGIL